MSLAALAASLPAPDRRIVDSVTVANLASETSHGYAGQADTVGLADGVRFRQTRGWLHYALRTFDDTEVTLALSFVPTDSVSRDYDVVVADSVIATRSYAGRRDSLPTVEVPVPFALTRGKASIIVLLRARGGLTPPLREVRTIQDHNEFDVSPHSFGASR